MVALFKHMGDERDNPEETHLSALGAGGKTQGGSEGSFTGAGVTCNTSKPKPRPVCRRWPSIFWMSEMPLSSHKCASAA